MPRGRRAFPTRAGVPRAPGATACRSARTARSAVAVYARQAPGEEPDEQRRGEPDDVQVVALDPLDERGAEALDRVRPRPTLPLAARHVPLDVARAERPERHERRLPPALLPVRRPQ